MLVLLEKLKIDADSRWRKLWLKMSAQGFSIENYADLYFAAKVLHECGFHIIDQFQLKRILKCYHLYLVPHIPANVDAASLTEIHDVYLKELLLLKKALWGWVGYFESAFHRLQQIIQERDVKGLQAYLQSYARTRLSWRDRDEMDALSASEEKKDVQRDADADENQENNDNDNKEDDKESSVDSEAQSKIVGNYISILKMIDADQFGYLPWCLSTDYENILHQCLHQQFIEGIYIMCTSSTLNHCEQFNQRDRWGNAPIHVAAQHLQVIGLKYLLQVPAVDVDLPDRQGKRVLQILLLRLQMRWNSYRRRFSVHTISSTLTNGGGMKAIQQRVGLMDPSPDETLELIKIVLEKCDSIADTLLHKDRNGLTALDYCLGLQDSCLVLYLLGFVEKNSPSCFLESDTRIKLFLHLLHSAVIMDDFDLVHVIGTKFLSINTAVLRMHKQSEGRGEQVRSSSKRIKGTRSYSHSGHMRSPQRKARDNGENKQDVYLGARASELSDIIALCVTQGKYTALQSLLSLLPSSLTNTNNSTTQQKLSLNSSFSYGVSQNEDAMHGSSPAFVTSVNIIGTSGLLPLEVAIRMLDEKSMQETCTKMSGSGQRSYMKDNTSTTTNSSSGASGLMGKSNTVDLQYLRSLVRAGADPLIYIDISLYSSADSGAQEGGAYTRYHWHMNPKTYNRYDNLFALAAENGNIDVLRLLLLNLDEKRIYPMLNQYSFPVDESLEVSLDGGKRDNGPWTSKESLQEYRRNQYASTAFFIGGQAFVSNPLVYAILAGNTTCLEYLLVHTPFKLLVNVRNGVEIKAHYSKLRSELDYDLAFGRVGGGGGGGGLLTPLAAAAMMGDVYSIKVLLDHGARITDKILLHNTNLLFPSPNSDVAFESYQSRVIMQHVSAVRSALTEASRADPFYEQLPEDFKAKQGTLDMLSSVQIDVSKGVMTVTPTKESITGRGDNDSDSDDTEEDIRNNNSSKGAIGLNMDEIAAHEKEIQRRLDKKEARRVKERTARSAGKAILSGDNIDEKDDGKGSDLSLDSDSGDSALDLELAIEEQRRVTTAALSALLEVSFITRHKAYTISVRLGEVEPLDKYAMVEAGTNDKLTAALKMPPSASAARGGNKDKDKERRGPEKQTIKYVMQIVLDICRSSKMGIAGAMSRTNVLWEGLFRNPSVFASMARLTTLLTVHVHNALIRKTRALPDMHHQQTNTINFSLKTVQQHAKRGLDFMKDGKVKSQWLRHVHNSRVHKLLLIINDWLSFVEKCCTLLQGDVTDHSVLIRALRAFEGAGESFGVDADELNETTIESIQKQKELAEPYLHLYDQCTIYNNSLRLLLHRPFYSYAYHYIIRPSTAIEPSADLRPQSVEHPLARGSSSRSGNGSSSDAKTSRSTGIYQLMQHRTSKPEAGSLSLFSSTSINHHRWLASSSWDALLPWWYDIVINSELLHRQRAYRRAYHSGSLQNLGTSISGLTRGGAYMDNTVASDRLGRLPLTDQHTGEFGALSDSGRLYVGVMKNADGEGWLTPVGTSSSTVPFPSLSGVRETHSLASLVGNCDNDGCDWSMVQALSPLIMAHDEHPARFLDLCTSNGGSPAHMTYASMVREGFALERNINAVFHCVRSLDAKSLTALLLSNVMASFEQFTDLRPLNSRKGEARHQIGSKASEDDDDDDDIIGGEREDGMDRKERKKMNKKKRRRVLHRALQAGDDEKCVSFWGQLRRELSRAASTHFLHNQTSGNVSDDVALIAGIIEVARATDLDRLYGEGSANVSTCEWRRLYLPRIDRTYIEVKGRNLRRNQQYSYFYDVAARRAYNFASTVIVRRKVEMNRSEGGDSGEEDRASRDVFEVVGVHGLALPGSLLSHFDRQLPTHYSTASSMDTSHLDRNQVLSNFLCLPRVTNDLELVFKGDLLINLATRASPQIASLLPEVLGPTVLGWGSVHLVGGIRNLCSSSGNNSDGGSIIEAESVCSLVSSGGNTNNLSALLATREKDPYCISRNKSVDRYSALSSGGANHHDDNSISGERERIVRTRNESASISLTQPTSRGLQFRPLAYVRLLERGSENRVRKALQRAQVLRSVAHIAVSPDKTGSSYTNNSSTANSDSFQNSNTNTSASSILQQFCEIPTFVDELLSLMDATHALLELSRPINALMQQLHDNKGSIKENRNPNSADTVTPLPSLLYVLLRSCLVKDEQTLLAFYRHLSKRPVDVMHKVVGQMVKNFHRYETEILAPTRSSEEREKGEAPFLDMSTNDQIGAECERLRSSPFSRHPDTSEGGEESSGLPTYSNDVNLWVNWFHALRPFCGSSGQSFVGWVDLLEDTLLHHVSADLQNWLRTGKNLHERYNVQQGEEVLLDQPHVFQQAVEAPVTSRNFLTKQKQSDKTDRDVSNEILMDRELAVSSHLVGHTEYLNQAQPVLIELFAAMQEKKEVDAIAAIVKGNVEAILNYRQVRSRSQFGGRLDADEEVSDAENVWLPVSVLPLICFSSSQLGLAIHHPVSSLYSAIGSTLKTLFGSETIANLSVQASKRQVSLVAALVALYISKESSLSENRTASAASQLGVQIDARQQRLANSVMEQLTLMVDEEILPYLSGHNYDKLYHRVYGGSTITMWLLQQQYHLRRLSYHLYTSLMALHNNSLTVHTSLPIYRALAHKHPAMHTEGALLLLSAIRSLKASTVQCVLRSISGGKLSPPPNASFPLLLNTAAAAGQRSVFFSVLGALLPQQQDAGGGQAMYSSGAVRDILSEDLASETSTVSTGTPSTTWNCLASALCGSTNYEEASEGWVPPDIWTLGYFEVPYKEDMYSLPEDIARGGAFTPSGKRASGNNSNGNNGDDHSEGEDLDASMVDDYAFRNNDDRTAGILRNQGMRERQRIVEFLLNPEHVHVHSMVAAVEPRSYSGQPLLSALDLAAIYGYWDSIERLLVGYYGVTTSTTAIATATGNVEEDGMAIDGPTERTTPTKADNPEQRAQASPKVSTAVPVNVLDELHLSAPASAPCFLWIHAAVLGKRSAVMEAVRMYTNERDALAAGYPIGHVQGASASSPGTKEGTSETIPDTPESYQPPTLGLTDEGDVALSSTDRFAGYGSLLFVQKLLLSVRTFALQVYTGVYSRTLHDDHSTSTRSGRGVYFRPEGQLSKEVSETLRQLPPVDLRPNKAARETLRRPGVVDGDGEHDDSGEDAEDVQDTMTAPRSLFEYMDGPSPAENGSGTHSSVPGEDSFSRTASSYGMEDTGGGMDQPTEPRMHYSHSLLHDAIATGDEANALEVLHLTMHVSSCISSKTDFNTYFGSAHDGEDLSSWRYRYYTIGLLHYAVYFDCPAVLAHLLDSAAAATSGTSDFNRPTYTDGGRWRLDVNAKVALPFPGIEGYLWTPLQLAAHCGRSDCIALLLAHTNWPLEVDISSPTVANTHPPRLASDFGHTHTINPVYSIGRQWMDLGIALSLAVRSHADSSAHHLLTKLMERMKEYRSRVRALGAGNDTNDGVANNDLNEGGDLQTPVKADRSQDYISPASSNNTTPYTPSTPAGPHIVVLDLCPNIFPSLFGHRDASNSNSNHRNISMSSEAQGADPGQYNHITEGINLESLVLPRVPEMNFTHLLTVLVNRDMVQTLVAVFAWEDEMMRGRSNDGNEGTEGGVEKDKETLFHLLVRDAASLGYSEMVLVLLERCFHKYNFFQEGAIVHTFTPVRTLVVLLESGYADRLKFEQQEVEEEDDWDDGRDRAPVVKKEAVFSLSKDGTMTRETLHHLINLAESVSDLRTHLPSLKSMCTAKHFTRLGDIESKVLGMSQGSKADKGYASINSRISSLKRQVQRIGESDSGVIQKESEEVEISAEEEAYNELHRQTLEAKKKMPLIMKVNNRTIILRKPEKRVKAEEAESTE